MRFQPLSRLVPLALLLMPVFACAEDASDAIPDAMARYVARVEPDYQWTSVRHIDSQAGDIDLLELTSQRWHDIVWKHSLTIFHPRDMQHPDSVLLFVTGGRTGGIPDDKDFAMGRGLANLAHARVAIIHQVPNQPLLGDHVEDDLITETWLRYLSSGDDTWPLLFPMVKSAVKAMDAVQEFVRQEHQADVTKFVITGASKRGWTSWLTPVVDQRIVATAPIVIDVLNFPAQMKNQLRVWGNYSLQINDYTSKGLIHPSGEPRTPREKSLWKMMDPYTYRKQLTLPKLMIVGTNDPYWVVDAMNIYWDDLAGPRFVLQVPNAGHGLDGGKDHALKTLAIYFRHAVSGTPLPEIEWTPHLADGNPTLEVHATPQPAHVRLWTAQSPNRDFRESRWTSRDVTRQAREARIPVDLPATGSGACFAELEFRAFDVPYSLTTLVFVKDHLMPAE